MDLKNDLYEVLFEAIQEGLVLVDSKGEIVNHNKMGAAMFGYEAGELLGKRIEVLVPAKARNIHKKHRSNYSQDPKTRSMGAALKLDGVRKDGSEFPVQVSLNPFISKNGERYVISLISDITERRRNEDKLSKLRKSLEDKVRERTKELRESEHLYKSIALNFPSGIISIFDSSFTYLFAEGQGIQALGMEAADLTGTNYLQRFDRDTKNKIKRELKQVFNGIFRNFEVMAGKETFSINAVPLVGDSENIEKILVVERNITSQKRVANRLEDTLHKERELADMKSRFVSMASHEFRTPLSTINSSASLIKKYHEKGRYSQLDKHTDRIRNAVQNLTSILNDFLSFEKLEADKVSVYPSQCDIPQILEEAFDEISAITKENQHIQYLGPDELLFSTDGQLLKNTMLNILSNAVKYSMEDGKIIVSLEDQSDAIFLTIQDFGIGIPQKDQKNLFTRFFRAKNVTNIEGTGLGLIIVQRYLDLLNGEISFTSKVGKGTTFYITLWKTN